MKLRVLIDTLFFVCYYINGDNMVKISASLLSCKDNLEDALNEFNNINIDYIHLDIMDGKFVPYTSFNDNEINYIINNSNVPLDVHLMVLDVDYYINKFDLSNVHYITFHYEILKDIGIIKKIKEHNIKCGISINPSTKVEVLYDLLPFIDMVLVMSVNPGQGGQKFIDKSLEKIKKLREFIDKSKLNVIISVDGGINNNTAKYCIKNGVDMLVIGSALVNSDDKNKFIEMCKDINI